MKTRTGYGYMDIIETNLSADEIKAIKTTVRLVFNQSEIAAEMVLPIMMKMASHTRTTGAGSGNSWLAALKALSEICGTLHKMILAGRKPY